MQIRKAQDHDLNLLSALFDSYRVFYGRESDVVGSQEFLIERLKHDDSEIFVAESADQKLVGFVQFYPLFSSTRIKKYWLLNDLFVSGDFRNRGISIALMDKAKELVVNTKACGMYLETDKKNIVGNKL